MQSATAKSKGPMKATDRSVLQTSQKMSRSTSQSNMSKSSSNPKMKSFQGTPPVRSGSTGKSPLRSKKTGPVQSSSHKVNISQMSTTPEAKGQSHKASTPSTEDDKSFFADVSAIAPVDKRKKPSGDSSTSLLATSSSGLHDSHESQPKSGKKKAKPIVSQRRLDIEYARYIQWLYLDAKIHKVFEEQEKEAMGQMYALHEENQKLEQRKEDLELTLAQLQYVNALDDALDVQQSGLHTVSQSLPKLDSEHQTLTQALDTTRHQIAARGVYIPDDEDEYYRNLEATLMETEQLLGELSVMCRQKQPKITNFASVVQTLQKDVDLETDELARCKELVAACQTLATEEGSLVVQDLQREAQCILQH